jgi:hypothetical protein
MPMLPADPSPPVSQSYVVSGIVSLAVDEISRPIADRSVRLWIEPPNASGGRAQSSATDPNGRYTAQVPARSRVFVWASTSSFDQQPCIVSATVDKDTTLDVQVFPHGSFPKAPSAAGPLITGFVYQATPQGRSPVRANIQLGLFTENYVAWARTDEAGHFLFCRVNTPVGMEVAAPGVSGSFFQSIPGTGDMFLEIELGRWRPGITLEQRAAIRLDALLTAQPAAPFDKDCGQIEASDGEEIVSREGLEPSTRRLRVPNEKRNSQFIEQFCAAGFQNVPSKQGTATRVQPDSAGEAV